MDCGHGISHELGFGHLLVDVGQVEICVQQKNRITDGMNNVWYIISKYPPYGNQA